MRQIIGICGAAGSGKDAVAAVLIARRGFVKRSFAQALREEVRRAMIDREYCDSIWDRMPPTLQVAFSCCHSDGDIDPFAKPTSPEMRVLLQHWGVEFRRAQNADYWVKRAKDSLPLSGRFVFTDVRFPNEYRLMRRLGGIVWRVERYGVPGNGHISETYWPHFECDAVIRNDGTVDDLKRFVLELCAAAPSSSLNSAESQTTSASSPKPSTA
jgi:hypothetical protein